MTSAAVLMCGCQFIGGFAGNEIVDVGPGGEGGGGASLTGGGGTGGQGGMADECALDQVPEEPDDATVGDEVTFILAARTIELGEDLDETLGLDIDDACTCSDDVDCPCASVATCSRPPLVDSDDKWQRCDSPGGVDSNSRQLFNIITSFDPLLSSQFISLGMAAGGGTTLLEVREYNGLADDGKVFVGVYATGTFQSADCNTGPPQWDGEDAWPISNDSVFAALPTCGEKPFPTVYDTKAYVVDHNLVARLDEVTVAVQFGANALKLTVSDAIVVAPLQQDAEGRWSTTRGTVAGRWKLADVFRGLGELDKVTPIDLCDPATLGSTQSNVCAFVDTIVGSGSDGECNAVSFALEFEAEEARAGNSVDLPSSDPCPALLNLDCETQVQ